MKILKRIGIGFAVLIVATLLAGFYLLGSEPVPETMRYRIDLPEFRALARSLPGDLPNDIRFEIIASGRLPRISVSHRSISRVEVESLRSFRRHSSSSSNRSVTTMPRDRTGHTGGSQMVFVTLADGHEFLFVGDVVWNFDAVTDFVLGEDRWAVLDQIRALRNLHDAGSVSIIVSHDRRRYTGVGIKEGFVIAGS